MVAVNGDAITEEGRRIDVICDKLGLLTPAAVVVILEDEGTAGIVSGAFCKIGSHQSMIAIQRDAVAKEVSCIRFVRHQHVLQAPITITVHCKDIRSAGPRTVCGVVIGSNQDIAAIDRDAPAELVTIVGIRPQGVLKSPALVWVPGEDVHAAQIVIIELGRADHGIVTINRDAVTVTYGGLSNAESQHLLLYPIAIVSSGEDVRTTGNLGALIDLDDRTNHCIVAIHSDTEMNILTSQNLIHGFLDTHKEV